MTSFISLSHYFGGILAHSSLTHCFSSLGFPDFTLIHSSLKIPAQQFSQAKVRTLTLFFSQTFCCRFAAVIIALLHDLIFTKLYFWTDGLIFDYRIH